MKLITQRHDSFNLLMACRVCGEMIEFSNLPNNNGAWWEIWRIWRRNCKGIGLGH